MRIYITHCCAKKDDSLKDTDKKVSPERLYIATPTQRFINKCKIRKVNWAIFSDLYGVWFSNEKHEWYEKDPSKVTEHEFEFLLDNFKQSLSKYDEICFYYNPGRFHPLYKRLLKETELKHKIKRFTHIADII